jgi:hypothetical protein
MNPLNPGRTRTIFGTSASRPRPSLNGRMATVRLSAFGTQVSLYPHPLPPIALSNMSHPMDFYFSGVAHAWDFLRTLMYCMYSTQRLHLCMTEKLHIRATAISSACILNVQVENRRRQYLDLACCPRVLPSSSISSTKRTEFPGLA